MNKCCWSAFHSCQEFHPGIVSKVYVYDLWILGFFVPVLRLHTTTDYLDWPWRQAKSCCLHEAYCTLKKELLKFPRVLSHGVAIRQLPSGSWRKVDEGTTNQLQAKTCMSILAVLQLVSSRVMLMVSAGMGFSWAILPCQTMSCLVCILSTSSSWDCAHFVLL